MTAVDCASIMLFHTMCTQDFSLFISKIWLFLGLFSQTTSGRLRWGLEVDLLDPALLQVCGIVPNSIVDRYNETLPEEKQIQVGKTLNLTNIFWSGPHNISPQS